MLCGSLTSPPWWMFGMIEIDFAEPLSTRETSTIQVELIAATYAMFEPREKWTSCGRQRPRALVPPGPFMTTHVNEAAAGQRVASARPSSIRR